MNKTGSFFGGLAVIAIAVVFIVNFQPGGGQNQLKAGPECAAEVHGHCVRSIHFWASYRLLSPTGTDLSDAQKRKLKEQTLDGLVERELLLEEAERLGIGVSEEDVSRELFAGRLRASLPVKAAPHLPAVIRNFREAFLDRKTKKFSPETYKRVITEMTLLSEADFRETQRSEMIAARMRDAIRSRVRVSEAEAFQAYRQEKATVSVEYTMLSPLYYAHNVLDTSDAAVDAWIAKNDAEVAKGFDATKYKDGCRQARHILVKFDGEPNDESRAAAKAKMAGLEKRLADGDKFAAIAKEHSADTVSAKDGGSLGCVIKGQMTKPFEDALFALEAGKVSEVVATTFGLHLIVVDKVLEGEEAATAGKRSTARGMYLVGESKRLAEEGAKEIIAAVNGGQKLDAALAAHLAKVLPPKSDKTKDKEKGDQAPDPDRKNEPEDKESVPAPKDAHDDDQPTAPVVESSLPFGRSGQPFLGALDGPKAAQMAFTIPAVGKALDKPVELENGGLAVMVLLETKDASPDDWKEQRDFYMSGLRNQKQMEAIVTYVKRLRAARQQDIKINAEFTKEFAAPVASGSAAAPAPNPFEAPTEPE